MVGGAFVEGDGFVRGRVRVLDDSERRDEGANGVEDLGRGLAVVGGSRVGITYHEEEGEEEDEVGEDHSRRPLGEGELLGLVGEAPVDVLPGSAEMLVNHFGGVAVTAKRGTRFKTRKR